MILRIGQSEHIDEFRKASVKKKQYYVLFLKHYEIVLLGVFASTNQH